MGGSAQASLKRMLEGSGIGPSDAFGVMARAVTVVAIVHCAWRERPVLGWRDETWRVVAALARWPRRCQWWRW